MLILTAQNEIYYTLASSDILVPNVIVSRCVVSGGNVAAVNKGKSRKKSSHLPMKAMQSSLKKGSSSKAPEAEDEGETDDESPSAPAETFCCLYAIHSQRGLYYDFKWDRHCSQALKTAFEVPEDAAAQAAWGSGEEWNVDTTESVRKAKKKAGPPPKKRVKVEEDVRASSDEDVDSGSEAEIQSEPEEDDELSDVEESDEDVAGEDDDDFDALEPRRPSKKRKRGQAGPKTPNRRRASVAQPTPHSKRAIIKRRKLKAAVNGSPRKRKLGKVPHREPKLSFETDMSYLPPDPWLRAMHVLHVGNRPEALPCRSDEYSKVFACVEELLEEGSGGCICRLSFMHSLRTN